MTVTSQVSGFPASQGTTERPSGRFPSDQLRPSGSLAHGMPAETIARATKSFRAWCLADLPGAFLQTKPRSPCASTRAPQCSITLTSAVKCDVLESPSGGGADDDEVGDVVLLCERHTVQLDHEVLGRQRRTLHRQHAPARRGLLLHK